MQKKCGHCQQERVSSLPVLWDFAVLQFSPAVKAPPRICERGLMAAFQKARLL